MGLWNRLTGRSEETVITTLAGVTTATDVRLEGTLISPSSMTSPLTGLGGVLFHWTFYAQHWDPYDPEPIEFTSEAGRFERLEEIVRAGELLLRCLDGVVRIPTQWLELGEDSGARFIERLEAELPVDLSRISQQAKAHAVFFRERRFLQDDPVLLVATVEPMSQSSSAYRSSGDQARFAARSPATLLGKD
jgi:hypothetical protein